MNDPWNKMQLVTCCARKYSTKFRVDTSLNYCLVFDQTIS